MCVSSLRSNLKSLRMVLIHSNRHFAHLCFRAWRYQVKISKKRDKAYRASLKKKKKRRSRLEGAPNGGDDSLDETQIVKVFMFWRSYARSSKLHRLLTLEVDKLQVLLTKVTSEMSRKKDDNTTLAENLQIMCLKLHQFEESRSAAPLKPDEYFSNTFMELLFIRCERELEALKEAKDGFIPLFKLAPRYTRTYATNGTNGQPPPIDLAAQTDILLKQLSFLSRKNQWETRSTLFTAIAAARLNEEKEESKMLHELSVMDVEDFLVIWTNHVLQYHPLNLSSKNGTTHTKVRKLRDLSTDLRDSTLYMQLLQVLGPELPTQKVEKLVRTHIHTHKAKRPR